MTQSRAGRLVAGRYQLSAVLGHGGMGVVWEAVDRILDRDVAIKEVRFPPGLSQSDRHILNERTLREARAAARIDHPNVVRVYDVVQDGGQPWLVMELVLSRSLAEIVRDSGPLPEREVARIGLQMLDALEAAHGVGILHRDIKPANVLLTRDGRAVLTDFGVARLEGDATLTSTGTLIGSPSYMAPERVQGWGASTAADLFSLGATLYAALQGSPPYAGADPVAVLAAVVTEEPPVPSGSESICAAITGLMRKDPARRMGPDEARSLLRRAAGSVSRPALARGRDLRSAFGSALGSRIPHRRTGDATATGTATGTTAGPRPASAPKARTALAAAAAVLAVVIGAFALTRLVEPGGSAGPGTAASPGQAGDVPAGYVAYTDPSGFRVAVPRGWHVSPSGPRQVDFISPDTLLLLRIGWTFQPASDPYQEWLSREPEQQRKRGYARLSLGRASYRDYAAADWEFVFEGRDGRTYQAVDRNFVVVPDGLGYTIYAAGPEGAAANVEGAGWNAARSVFDVAVRTFQPAPTDSRS